ncbi:MAG: nitroreductase family protein [Planctomycetota bacterium]
MEKGIKNLDYLILTRRSIRKYLDKRVEPEKMRCLLEALRMAPSACNAQPWRLVVVTQKELLNKISDEGLGGIVSNKWAKTAPAIIVACSDLSLHTHRLGEMVQGVKYHLIDMGIALEHLALKAVELGLGTCYIGWFNEKPIKQILNIPSSWKVECLLTLGYSAETPGASPRKALEEIVFYNRISN